MLQLRLGYRFQELEQALSLAEGQEQEAEGKIRKLQELQDQLTQLNEKVGPPPPMLGCQQDVLAQHV